MQISHLWQLFADFRHVLAASPTLFRGSLEAVSVNFHQSGISDQ
ncbi:hypothetical Protein YC6258_00425 [Gynuella sunshinyii YC6258]|uniref:Uncharacterized protein n=1 Tax=Gynuella sunshinyii YC6258 TaxID=1445510 RepID=A0A0C5UYS4_9GAMM|nr:hypothetical Protein YC6258_00425 [Gynuella sunshinyii YC6258]